MPSHSRREREIMDALFAAGEADVEEIRRNLVESPGYDSVRTILRILESKGHVRHRIDGRRHIYRPAQSRSMALKNAWQSLVNTFFEGSEERAAATLLKTSERTKLDEEEIAALVSGAKRARQRKAGK